MAEYQRRMDVNRARVKLFDEENKILGQMLTNPKITENDKEVDAWPFKVVLRLPKGISGSIAGEKEHGIWTYKSFRIFLYPADVNDYAVFVSAGLVGKMKKEKATGEESGWPCWSEAVFRSQVVATLLEYFRNVRLGNMKFPDADFNTKVRKNIDVPVPGAAKPATLAFDRYVWEGTPGRTDKTALAFVLYQHVAGDKQIAVVFQLPAAKKDDADETRKMETSLRTLVLRGR